MYIVEGLHKFKRELEILNDEKESQEKDALQRAAELRTEIVVNNQEHTGLRGYLKGTLK